jgi:hypothetical protein
VLWLQSESIRHPEVLALSTSHRKSALADLRNYIPMSGNPDIGWATAQDFEARGCSSFEARRPGASG